MSEVLKTEQLAVGYGKRIVVKDVSISLEAGKVLTLIGPNGSGKSTILKTITKQLKILGGSVSFAGQAMKEMKEAELAKQMSMVMTERIHPELMTCKEVVATGRYPYTGRFGILTKEDWKSVEEAMELVHADEVAGALFLKISDGQKQRVMLARAICQNTQIMVLDEPTSYLDIRYKLEILQHIRTLAQKRKTTVIMSLHELDLVPKVSDLVACVEGDTLGKIADPEQVFCGDYIQKLYGVAANSFDPVLGAMYLPVNHKKPECFVIGGGGTGISFYQKLQREQIPFATGILSKNDIDYSIAKSTASEVVATESFYPIEEKHIAQAKKIIDLCRGCICTLKQFGPYNRQNEILYQYAKERNKLIVDGPFTR